MRVTQSETYRNFITDLETLNANFSKVNQQVSSGKALTQLGDSPTGSAELVSLTELESEADQYQSNTDTGSYFLNSADSALNEVNNLVTSIYTDGTQAASGATSQDARATLAEEIGSLRDQVLSLANSQVNGRYIFAGSQVTSAPFVLNGNSVSYQGDSDVDSISVDDGITVQLGVPGSSAFNSIFAAIQSLLTAVNANDTSGMQTALGQFSTALSELGQARGQIDSNLSLLQNVTTDLNSKETSLKEQQSKIEDVDTATAAVQLNQTNTAIQTAMAAGGIMLQQGDLFDILG